MGIMRDGSFILNTRYLFHMKNLFQNGANDTTELVNINSRIFVKKIQILCSYYHPTLFKFHQVVVKTFSKELQIVFWTYTFSNSNGY